MRQDDPLQERSEPLQRGRTSIEQIDRSMFFDNSVDGIRQPNENETKIRIRRVMNP